MLKFGKFSKWGRVSSQIERWFIFGHTGTAKLSKKCGGVLMKREVIRDRTIRVKSAAFENFGSTRSCSTSETEDSEEIYEENDHSDFFSAPYSHLEIDDQNLNYRLNLYPDDPDPVLAEIFKANTIQQIFDCLDKTPVSLRHSAQSLVSLWDLQKFLFRINLFFDPGKELVYRTNFIGSIRSNDTFISKILHPMLENTAQLEDEPLAASLLSLVRMNYDVRTTCSQFIDEAVKRKDTFCLTGLSRLSVCLKFQSLYGYLILANFSPLIEHYVENMKSDTEVRLVAVTLRNCSKILSNDIANKYISNVIDLLQNKQTLGPMTLSKQFAMLMELKKKGNTVDRELEFQLCNLIVPRLRDNMHQVPIIDLLGISKYLDIVAQQPTDLFSAVTSRMTTLLQENYPPRLDILAAMASSLSGFKQQQKLAYWTKRYLEDYCDFESICNLLLHMLKCNRIIDQDLYFSYWKKYQTLVEVDNHDYKRNIKAASDYIAFIVGKTDLNRTISFETTLLDLMYFYLDQYIERNSKTFISPPDFNRLFAFIIAFSPTDDKVFQSFKYVSVFQDFCSQLKIPDLSVIAKGLDIAWYSSRSRVKGEKFYEKMLHICSIIEMECAAKFSSQDLSTIELLLLCKVLKSTERYLGSSSSPLFDELINEVSKRRLEDSRSVKELCNLLLGSKYYSPQAMDRLTEFVLETRENMNRVIAYKFISLSFDSSLDIDSNPKLSEAIKICLNIIENNLSTAMSTNLIQASIALCYNRLITSKLVHEIFSVDFVDQIDSEIKNVRTHFTSQLNLRKLFMALNRSVCLDFPEMRVPWFHQKFCEELLTTENVKVGDNFTEVKKILNEIFNNTADSIVQEKVFSPYYYFIDFLILFDKNGHPIRRKPQSQNNKLFSTRVLKRNVESDNKEIERKIAIIVQTNDCFTKNVRRQDGSSSLRRRHLEILGYNVIEIDPRLWDSMHMSEPQAKRNYLESEIFKYSNPSDSLASKNKSNIIDKDGETLLV